MNIPRQNLRTPGPTPVPEDIVEAMGAPMINHRGPEFHELINRVTSQLKQVFMTQSDLFILTASGTGSLEAAIVNTLSPGDRVIAATAGSFGDRFVDLARAYGVDLTVLEFEWGAAVDPDAIRQALLRDPAVKAVMVTHNETSTGITHPLEEMAQVVKGEFHKLLLGRCGQQPGLHSLARGRLGLRRCRHCFPEGIHDPAGSVLREYEPRCLGGSTDRHPAQVLL